jgi:hypothetical protein
MYLEVLYRVRACPIAHLGRRSLTRLDAFHVGYSFFPQITKTKDYALSALRDWTVARYQPEGAEAKDATQVLLDAAPDDECAFDLFFTALDAVTVGRPEDPAPRERPASEGEPLPASGYLDVLTSRPAMFLRRITVGCLRAFLDGYGLAAIEEGHAECLDLDGFEHWVRRQLYLKGYFRWEDAVLGRFNGDEAAAFQCALRELKAYRTSKGPISPRRYEVVVVGDQGRIGTAGTGTG